jgi:hypothetical protein
MVLINATTSLTPALKQVTIINDDPRRVSVKIAVQKSQM